MDCWALSLSSVKGEINQCSEKGAVLCEWSEQQGSEKEGGREEERASKEEFGRVDGSFNGMGLKNSQTWI